MLHKKGKILHITILKAIFSLILLAFVYSPGTSYAQYSQVDYNGRVYTYVDNYNNLSIATDIATNITSSSANLNGLINGNNLYNTSNLNTWFEYGTDTNLTYSTVPNNSNSGYANFISNISNLSPNTVYYFRAVAQTPRTAIYGITNSFRTNFANSNNPATPITTTTNHTTTSSNNVSYGTPNIITNPATAISNNSAEMNALIINSKNNALTWFEWGVSSSLGNKTETVAIGAFPSVKHVDTITGLLPGTTYYFRAIVENSSKRVIGDTLNFTTNGVSNQNTVEGNTENTTSIDTNLQPARSALGANVIESSSFLPENILGWFILIILILILIIMSKHLCNKFPKNKYE